MLARKAAAQACAFFCQLRWLLAGALAAQRETAVLPAAALLVRAGFQGGRRQAEPALGHVEEAAESRSRKTCPEAAECGDRLHFGKRQ